MELVFVRHGETTANLENRYCGHLDIELSENGMIQTKKLIDKLENEKFDKIYSSPLKRTRIISSALSDETEFDERIREFNFGCFEGMTYKQIQSKYPEIWSEWVKQNKDYIIMDGESMNMFDDRVHSFLLDCLKSEYERILVVTHGGVIRSMMAKLLELGEKSKWHFNIKNAVYVKISFSEDYAAMDEFIQINS
jgi:alpha-ribazole phosphatase